MLAITLVAPIAVVGCVPGTDGSQTAEAGGTDDGGATDGGVATGGDSACSGSTSTSATGGHGGIPIGGNPGAGGGNSVGGSAHTTGGVSVGGEAAGLGGVAMGGSADAAGGVSAGTAGGVSGGREAGGHGGAELAGSTEAPGGGCARAAAGVSGDCEAAGFGGVETGGSAEANGGVAGAGEAGTAGGVAGAGEAGTAGGVAGAGGSSTPPPKQLRGLGVIADFADRELEEYLGEGIRDPSDLRQQLDSMQEHWAWLSRGAEQYQWDILRVTLPADLSAAAYAWWGEYRDAVVEEVKKVAPISTYDVDQDGIYDALWVIASNGGTYYDYMVGGASRNNGANLFVDEQGSYSIQANATGNFNHELGHLRGLPDLYGPQSTIHQMSIMADSWPVPPNDFCAYDRYKLGWAEVTEITESTTGVVLPSANERPAVVRVSTLRPEEYFLIEYRVRPSSGYASTGVSYRGLGVYHVLAGSNPSVNPPELAMVPADGVIVPNVAFDPRDLLYPDNPQMMAPFVARSYYGSEERFHITNLASTSEEVTFDITLFPQSGASSNMLTNGGMEDGSAAPTDWITGGWKPSEGTFTWASDVVHSGLHSLQLTATISNDLYWEQEVSGLVIGQSYAFCGWVRGVGLQSDVGTIGANLSVRWVDADGRGQATAHGLGLGTYDWTNTCAVFQAVRTTQAVQCRLGHTSNDLTGTSYCDDLTLESLSAAF